MKRFVRITAVHDADVQPYVEAEAWLEGSGTCRPVRIRLRRFASRTRGLRLVEESPIAEDATADTEAGDSLADLEVVLEAMSPRPWTVVDESGATTAGRRGPQVVVRSANGAAISHLDARTQAEEAEGIAVLRNAAPELLALYRATRHGHDRRRRGTHMPGACGICAALSALDEMSVDLHLGP